MDSFFNTKKHPISVKSSVFCNACLDPIAAMRLQDDSARSLRQAQCP